MAFLATSIVIFVTGSNLARYGEVIAERTRVSVTWIGLFLVAAVTSLPELVTGVTSVTVLRQPDLAMGDILGSCLFNLSLAGLVLLVSRRRPTRANDHDIYRVGSVYVSVMFALVVLAILVDRLAWPAWVAGGATALLVVAYFIASRHLFQLQRRAVAPPKFDAGEPSGRRLATLFTLNALAVVVAAAILPYLARALAETYGFTSSFVGTSFLAGSTSLPEIVVVLTALRQGVPSLAIGGLVGSNLFDLVILALLDLVDAGGSILGRVSSAHVGTILFALAATWTLVLAAPPERRPRTIWVPLIFGAYIGALITIAVRHT